MTQKFIYEADLKTRGFERGLRVIESGTQRAIHSAQRMQLAFRHFSRGNIGRGFEQIGLAAAQMGATLRRVGEAGVTAGRQILSAFSGVLSIMRRVSLMGGVISGLLVAGGGKTILNAAEFESEVQRAAIQSSASSAQERALFRNARDVGIETPFTLMDIASTQKEFAQRGFGADDIVSLTNATKLLAVMGDTDMKTAGEVLAQVMNQFGIPMEQAESTALKLAAATVATALSGQEMFDALKDAGSAAGTFNLSLTETLAIVGELRKSLGGAEKSSVALRNLLLVASAIQAKNPKQLTALGLTEEEATSFNFMRGGAEPKSIVDVMKSIAAEFADKPEEAMKAGFEKRTILAFKKIADTSKETFTALQARIDDTATTQAQYNQIIELSDNKIKRIGATADAVFIAVGMKLREAFAVDDQVDGLNAKLADLESTITNMDAADVRGIVDTLGTGVVHAFSVGVQFLLESFIAIAPTLAKVMYEAAKGVASGLLDSDDFQAFKAAAAGMPAAEAAAERSRLASLLGVSDLSAGSIAGFRGLHGMTGLGAIQATHGTGIRRRVEAFMALDEERTQFDPWIAMSQARLKAAADSAGVRLQSNPTVRAIEDAMGNSDRNAYNASVEAARRGLAPQGAGDVMDMTNHGIMNFYGVGSGSSRAKPSRPVGSTPQERAQR